MSVRTTADERLDQADQNMKEAVKALSDIIVGECWGHDQFRADYTDTIHEVFNGLVKLRKKLDR